MDPLCGLANGGGRGVHRTFTQGHAEWRSAQNDAPAGGRERPGARVHSQARRQLVLDFKDRSRAAAGSVTAVLNAPVTVCECCPPLPNSTPRNVQELKPPPARARNEPGATIRCSKKRSEPQEIGHHRVKTPLAPAIEGVQFTSARPRRETRYQPSSCSSKSGHTPLSDTRGPLPRCAAAWQAIASLQGDELRQHAIKPFTDRSLARNGQRRAFTPAVILFIALPEQQDKSDPG
jgi:hypothetical protein